MRGTITLQYQNRRCPQVGFNIHGSCEWEIAILLDFIVFEITSDRIALGFEAGVGKPDLNCRYFHFHFEDSDWFFPRRRLKQCADLDCGVFVRGFVERIKYYIHKFCWTVEFWVHLAVLAIYFAYEIFEWWFFFGADWNEWYHSQIHYWDFSGTDNIVAQSIFSVGRQYGNSGEGDRTEITDEDLEKGFWSDSSLHVPQLLGDSLASSDVDDSPASKAGGESKGANTEAVAAIANTDAADGIYGW